MEKINELALFAGAGGGLLGSVLAGWRTACAVEIDPRCREILLARQRDGILDRFPIWSDVRTFDGRGWRGRIDLVTGGFPCPRWSTARRGRGDPPDMRPDMLRIVGEVRPRRVFAENVHREPIDGMALGLRRLGYHCLAIRAGASAVGAPHRRVRWWVAADADGPIEHFFPVDEEMACVFPGTSDFWADRPSIDPDVAHGVAAGLDVYSRAVGNGQVPQLVLAIAAGLGWVDNSDLARWRS